MTTVRFRQVDVFTRVPFRGNPVAVVLDGDSLSAEDMQRIAGWTNLSETTFVLQPTKAEADYRLRIFTPRHELPFAGHPTIASAHAAIEAGCDGVIASGRAIQVCRQAFPRPTIIVSPGIRQAGASSDDHKRVTTPADAIRLGADYLVVGRPILKDPNPREAAQRIIAEIDRALSGGGTASGARSMRTSTSGQRSIRL